MQKAEIEIGVKTHFKMTPYFMGAEVAIARERTGLNQTKFAELCGWTQQAQSNYESPLLSHSINSEGEPLKTINRVLADLNS